MSRKRIEVMEGRTVELKHGTGFDKGNDDSRKKVKLLGKEKSHVGSEKHCNKEFKLCKILDSYHCTSLSKLLLFLRKLFHAV